MVTYHIGTKRAIRRFVIRKRIGDDVRYFQVCSWEEVFKSDTNSEGWFNKWTPLRFISTRQFYTLNAQH